ncbi:MAG: DUF3426 domain-containing protein [Thermodesulfobacteriota bacterium]
MIIQCRKCETRFRFDETQVEGEGFWVRCSRCRDVFYQERYAAGDAQPAPSAEPEIPSVRISDAKRVPEDRFPIGEDRLPAQEPDKTEAPLMPRVRQDREVLLDPSREAAGAGTDGSQAATADAQTDDWEEEIDEEEFLETEPPPKRWGWVILKVCALLVLIALIAGGVYLWQFPDARAKALQWASPWLQGVPALERLVGVETQSREVPSDPIRLKEIRQRSVANLLGVNLRVVEGIAVNQSPYFQSKIRVRLVVSDANDAVLGEKIVYCGNILTDAELNTLAEAEIQRELSIPQGTDVINDRIAPNGEIPFMIVFSQEHAGAIKTVVAPAGADRVP